MRYFLVFLCGCIGGYGSAQKTDSLPADTALNRSQSLKAEILSGGFIDIAQNGQMNASARLFRLYIGEPGKWQIPVSVYSGVSANNFSLSRQNEDVAVNLINPAAGIFNINFDMNNRLAGREEKLTSLRLYYQAGFRFLSLFNSFLYKTITFYNLITGLGLTIITGAWEKNKPGNTGLFWLNFRGLYSNNPSAILEEFFQQPVKQHLFGYSIGLGIDITQMLNTRAFYFRFLNNQEIDAFSMPQFQLSFNYSLKY